MKKSKFNESQIVAILKEGEAGLPVAHTLATRLRILPRRCWAKARGRPIPGSGSWALSAGSSDA